MSESHCKTDASSKKKASWSGRGSIGGIEKNEIMMSKISFYYLDCHKLKPKINIYK